MSNIIITGTSRGIGRALANHFLMKGNDVTGISRGQTTIKHENYRHFTADVSIEEEVVNIFRTLSAEKKTIDILINNAGTASMNHIITTPFATIKKLTEINYYGTFMFSREAAKQMIRQKKGQIINMTTVAVPLSLEGEAAYAASKAAVEALTRISAKELAPFNIQVNAIGPSPIMTDLIKGVPKEKMDALINSLPDKRLGTLEEVIGLTEKVLAMENVTGEIFYMGGL